MRTQGNDARTNFAPGLLRRPPLKAPLAAPYAALDAWLWRRGIRDAAIRSLLCRVGAAALLALAAGAALLMVTSLLLWFGVGLLAMTWIFWGWARFFSRPGGGLEPGALMGALLRWAARMLVFALGLYGALRAGGSPLALAAGVAAGLGVGLVSYAASARRPRA
ncbi:hypothetical protein [Desulfovibrio sp.]|uniref:hypothetical protein n=1 Tax=Desulfovibrio sp. TaxID=885 RepID=UPI0023C303C3|nr:hypothetical protein [Desulfovibrio sp.]MDE7240640.1 hypothetical protein [Desulfovibrio sp.]